MTTTKQKRDMLIDLICKNVRLIRFDEQAFTPYELIERLKSGLGVK